MSVSASIENYRRTNTEKYREAANRVTVCFTRPIIFVIMVLITSNRLFGTVYPFKYRLYATKRRFFCTILCCSALAVSVVTLLALLNRFEETFLSVWFCCILTLYFVFCVFAYTKILAKLAESKHRITKTTSNTSNTSNEANTESQSLKRKNVVNFRLFQEGNNISLMIVCVYFVLIVIPYIAWSAICNWFKSVSLCHLWRGVVEIFFKLNCISDVFIYVLMDKQARNRLKRSLMKKVFSKRYQSRVFRSTTASVAAVGVYVVEDSNTTPTSTL